MHSDVPSYESRCTSKQAAHHFDRATLLQWVGDDEALVDELLGLFVSDCQHRLAEIESAIDERDWRRLRSAAHALKGAAANIAAPALANAAGALEQIADNGGLDMALDAWHHLSNEANALLHALATQAS